MILGQWVSATGTIFDGYKEGITNVAIKPNDRGFTRLLIGIDYGIANPTTFVLIGETNGNFYVLEEYYYDGRILPQQPDNKIVEALIKFIFQKALGWGSKITGIVIDPSALSLITAIKQNAYFITNRIPVYSANNEVLQGIKIVNALLNLERLKINAECFDVLREINSYSWDINAQKRGEDKPIKEHDHCMDALRYAIMYLTGGVLETRSEHIQIYGSNRRR